MNCYSLSTKTLTINGSLNNIWIISTSCVSECGNFINIDAESGHRTILYIPNLFRVNFVRKIITTKVMGLKQQIDSDIKKAMLAKNKEELEALRSIKSMILLAETEKGMSEEITLEAENKLLLKASKQRKESADIFQQQNRKDLADRELLELEVINRYLPKQLSEKEINSALEEIIHRLGAKGPQDMGKVMGIATKELAGKADGKMISQLVKKLLAP